MQARELRQNLTDAEKRLWSRLRARQLGARFRRQAPVGAYVEDFLSHEPKLIIELDGGQHTEERDAARTAWLESRGFRVIRFWNNEVQQEMEGVLEVIRTAIASPPTPTLPRKGGGRRSDAKALPPCGGGLGGGVAPPHG